MTINNKPNGSSSGCVAETAAELATTEGAQLDRGRAASGNTSVPHYWLLFNGAITGDDRLRLSPRRTLHLTIYYSNNSTTGHIHVMHRLTGTNAQFSACHGNSMRAAEFTIFRVTTQFRRLRRNFINGLKVAKSCSYESTSYSLVQTLLLHRMYRLGTIHSVTDRQTERESDSVTPIADHTACSIDMRSLSANNKHYD